MNSKVTKIIAGIAASIVSLGVIFYIIDAIDAVVDFLEFSEDFYSAIGNLYIFLLVFMIIALILAVTTAAVSFVPSVRKKVAINCLLISSLLLVLEKLAYRLGVIIITKKYLFPEANFNTRTIISLVFVALAISSILVALFMNLSKKSMAGSILGAVGIVFFFVVIIIDLTRSSDTTGFHTIYSIFSLVASIVMIGAFVFSELKDNKKPSLVSKPTNDSAEELLKLKKLLDAGAITQEEYEEKRKKYVASL